MNNIQMYFYTYIEERITFMYLSVWSSDTVTNSKITPAPEINYKSNGNQ